MYNILTDWVACELGYQFSVSAILTISPGLLLCTSPGRSEVPQSLCQGEYLFPQPDIPRSYLNQFIIIYKINGLLQAQLRGRSQLYGNIVVTISNQGVLAYFDSFIVIALFGVGFCFTLYSIKLRCGIAIHTALLKTTVLAYRADDTTFEGKRVVGVKLQRYLAVGCPRFYTTCNKSLFVWLRQEQKICY